LTISFANFTGGEINGQKWLIQLWLLSVSHN